MNAKNPPKVEPPKDEIAKILETSLENILGQNYVDEYSGSDKHTGVDEIANQLTQSILEAIKLQQEALLSKVEARDFTDHEASMINYALLKHAQQGGEIAEVCKSAQKKIQDKYNDGNEYVYMG